MIPTPFKPLLYLRCVLIAPGLIAAELHLLTKANLLTSLPLMTVLNGSIFPQSFFETVTTPAAISSEEKVL